MKVCVDSRRDNLVKKNGINTNHRVHVPLAMNPSILLAIPPRLTVTWFPIPYATQYLMSFLVRRAIFQHCSSEQLFLQRRTKIAVRLLQLDLLLRFPSFLSLYPTSPLSPSDLNSIPLPYQTTHPTFILTSTPSVHPDISSGHSTLPPAPVLGKHHHFQIPLSSRSYFGSHHIDISSGR